MGAIAALNLSAGSECRVTVVCRSNFEAVNSNGYTIESCDHGSIKSWKPYRVVNSIPQTGEDRTEQFDYIVCTTKNIADLPPPLTSLITPAVTSERTTVVLVQNGLNIEKPLIASFPRNPILSGVSLVGAYEPSPGFIQQDFPDTLFIGAFPNQDLPRSKLEEVSQEFVRLYSHGGKTKCEYNPEVGWIRWRKLVYNACLNPICAITGLDTGRIRLADGAVEGLVRPAMEEIRAAAEASGHELPMDIADTMIEMDPLTMFLPPSMLSDVRKGNFIEFENILGEPLREGEKLGVSMPTLRVLYYLCQAIQWRSKEAKGLVGVQPKGQFVK